VGKRVHSAIKGVISKKKSSIQSKRSSYVKCSSHDSEIEVDDQIEL